MTSFVSLEDLFREEIQKQIDAVLEDIELDYTKLVGPNIKSREDFVYGFEVGRIREAAIAYYQYKILGDKGGTEEEAKQAGLLIRSIIKDRLPEIRQAIARAANKLK
jgi:hypothetical protein